MQLDGRTAKSGTEICKSGTYLRYVQEFYMYIYAERQFTSLNQPDDEK